LVETLLDRRADTDVAEAEAAIERLAARHPTKICLRERHLAVAVAGSAVAGSGDPAAYRDLRDRYRDMARTLEFEGHVTWAEAMP
jgi:hypothetical protein